MEYASAAEMAAVSPQAASEANASLRVGDRVEGRTADALDTGEDDVTAAVMSPGLRQAVLPASGGPSLAPTARGDGSGRAAEGLHGGGMEYASAAEMAAVSPQAASEANASLR